ncbi:MAG: hypothetical protein ACKOBY_03830 [Cyanobium sp.]
MTPQRVALAVLAGLIAAAGVSGLAAGRAATPARTPEPTLQTFRMAEVELIGCRGVAMPHSARGSRPAEAPLLAAWSLERRWGVMHSNGRLQRFDLGRSSRETGAEAMPGLPPRWRLPWRVGGLDVELRFPSQPLGPKRWGGAGMLRITFRATGDVHALAVWVEERC